MVSLVYHETFSLRITESAGVLTFFTDPGSSGGRLGRGHLRSPCRSSKARRDRWQEPDDGADDGTLRFGRWTWRYNLKSAGRSGTIVTLSYDWSAVPDALPPALSLTPAG